MANRGKCRPFAEQPEFRFNEAARSSCFNEAARSSCGANHIWPLFAWRTFERHSASKALSRLLGWLTGRAAMSADSAVSNRRSLPEWVVAGPC
jgi:hypothetical protein